MKTQLTPFPKFFLFYWVLAFSAILWTSSAIFAQELGRLSVAQENPRYLSLGGIPVIGLGATHEHSWTPISRPQVDLLQDINRLAAIVERLGNSHIRGFVRCLPYDPMNHLHDGQVEYTLQPWKRLDDGKFDLEQFDPQWEKRLLEFLDAAKEKEILVSLEIWDDWSVTRGPGGEYDPGPNYAWNGHPFNPDNNINYDRDVLPHTTTVCNAPFYQTIPSAQNNQPVLRLQQHYVNRLLELTKEYPNLFYNLANESRANLVWSHYWADYLRERLPQGSLISDMPSTNRRDGGGECDHALAPPALVTSSRYDLVDIAQGVSRHEFGNAVDRQVLGGAARIREYQRIMVDAEGLKPLIVSKDYQRGPDGGTAIIWGRFIAGAAAFRYHRPGGDQKEVSDFQYEAVERLARFIDQIPFWKMQPLTGIVTALPGNAQEANVLGWRDHEYVVQLLGGDAGEATLRLNSGSWQIRLYEPKKDAYRGTGDESGVLFETKDGKIVVNIPEYDETIILHVKSNRSPLE